eukprot:110021-Chlamydomonas_euryale.AAC.1
MGWVQARSEWQMRRVAASIEACAMGGAFAPWGDASAMGWVQARSEWQMRRVAASIETCAMGGALASWEEAYEPGSLAQGDIPSTLNKGF